MNHDEFSSIDNASELPTELRHVAAQLKTLRPRADRLERERLVFLAGQASVSGNHASWGAHPLSPASRWAWPAALGAMTTVAAALFVMLISRPAGITPPSSRGELAISREALRDSPSRWRPEAFVGESAALSASDAFRGDIDQIIAMKQRLRASEAQSDFEWPIEVRPGSVLTPMSWDQVLNGS